MSCLGFRSVFVKTLARMFQWNNKITQALYFPFFLEGNDTKFQYVWCDHGIGDLKSRQYMIDYHNVMKKVLIVEILNH